MQDIVRLQRIELNNLKNVGKGIVQFSCDLSNNEFEEKADLLGIYGQNGSGKTTLVFAVELFKNLVVGNRLKEDCGNYIKYGENSTRCEFELSVKDENEQQFKATYEFELRHKETDNSLYYFDFDNEVGEENPVYISMEKLSLSKFVEGKWSKSLPVLSYREEDTTILSPKVRIPQLIKGNKKTSDELRVIKILMKKSSKSLLFSRELKKIIDESNMEEDYKNIFNIIREYAVHKLYIVNKMDSIQALPGNLNLIGISRIPVEDFNFIISKIETMNLVLKEIIPGLTIELNKLGIRYGKKNEEIILSQMIAIRNTTKVPLRYESEGIRKLISVLYGLIMMFNNSSVTLVVDEFDSGIFEYLLGEILRVVEEYGKGQFLFTSHNLRPLEVIDKKNILFTTTNENNRYLRFRNIKNSHNFRDLYFHDIVLGGQNECIYETTNPYMIRRAFRMAGDKDGQ